MADDDLDAIGAGDLLGELPQVIQAALIGRHRWSGHQMESRSIKWVDAERCLLIVRNNYG